MFKYFIFLLSITIMASSNAKAQRQADWCGTDEKLQEMIDADPSLRLKIELDMQMAADYIKNNSGTANKISMVPRIVPVVVHVMHQFGPENISRAQVQSAIDVLNRDFRKLNADTSLVRPVFQPYIADANFEFRLARIDPQGNCTDGVTRTFTALTENADDNIKSLTSWPSNMYFNIWVAKNILFSGGGGTILGYAQFPSSGIDATYGVLNRANYFGTVGTAVDDGRTITHEVGHCFNLYHTFQGSCGSDCSTTGDGVCDTPPMNSNTNSCGKNNNQNTCSNDTVGPSPFSSNEVDQVENYMSYASCQHMFSIGQKDRMDFAFSIYPGLQNLISASNLVATGTNNGYVAQLCKPEVDFGSIKDVGCEGTSIVYSNITTNAPLDSINFLWTFEGGTPATSTANNPVVTYNTAGQFFVKLIGTTAGGTDSLIKNNAIAIYPDTSSKLAPIFQGAENPAFPENLPFTDRWEVESPAGSSREWQRTTSSSASGVASVYILGFGMQKDEVHSLISPTFNFTAATNSFLKFKRGYVQRGTFSDQLRIYFSIDCGQTWQLRYQKTGAGLQSVPVGSVNGNTPFNPTSSQYKEDSVNINIFLNKTAVRIKFEFKAADPSGGQSLYIDDIEIGGLLTGISESSLDRFSQKLTVFPNPFEDQFQVNYSLDKKSNVSISLVDMIGKSYEVKPSGLVAPGDHTMEINTANLKISNGVYFLRMTVDNESITRKVIMIR